jgi:hypothetical protein
MTTARRRLSNLDAWRADPIKFIETVLYDPETNKPFVLLPAERDFLHHAFQLDALPGSPRIGSSSLTFATL